MKHPEATAPRPAVPAIPSPVPFIRQQTALDRANAQLGMACPTNEWRVHPECHNPPTRFGACTLRFPDGRYWCFGCSVAWTAGADSERLTTAMSL